MSKKILVVGGTGCIGTYLVPALLKRDYHVDVLAMDDAQMVHPNLTHIKGNALNISYISEILKGDYDAVVDFMMYQGKRFETYLPLYLNHTDHYIFLSSYRVYADEEHPIKETSPRILDVARLEHNEELLQSGDYCIYKAEAEDYLRSSEFSNWTIVRPAITYSKRRFQLMTLDWNITVRCMREGQTLILPEQAMQIHGTMSWAGDVAEMIARILMNKAAYRETYSLCTAEHHTWEEVAEIYKRIGGLNYVVVDKEDFFEVLQPGQAWFRRQLDLDRCYDRIMDNSKILNLTGMKQSELMPLEQGLAMEYAAIPKDVVWLNSEAYERMKAYLKNIGR